MKTDPGFPLLEEFEATIVTYDDAPDECTIYPDDIDDPDRSTTWISAKAGSYCSIADIQ